MVYAQARFLVIAFLIAYALSGFAIQIFFSDGTEDVYPLFSWSLFAKVPNNVQTIFEAYVVAIQGLPIEPVRLDSRPDLYQANTSGEMRSAIQEIGSAIVSNDLTRAQSNAGALAGKFVVPTTLEIRAEVVDVLEHYKTGAIRKSTVLTQFSVQ